MRNLVSVPPSSFPHGFWSLLWAPWRWRTGKLASRPYILDASMSMFIFSRKVTGFAISRESWEIPSVNELSPLGWIINIIKVDLVSQKNQRGGKYWPTYPWACDVKLPVCPFPCYLSSKSPFPSDYLGVIFRGKSSGSEGETLVDLCDAWQSHSLLPVNGLGVRLCPISSHWN